MSRTGGRLLVDELLAHGVDTAFCVPGESYLAVLDALHDAPIRLVSCRHEAAAANMAEAYGKLTGRPGVCLVTRGPGATHASIGVHIANQDSTPMILLVGHVPREMVGLDSFQEVDLAGAFAARGLAKWAARIDEADRVPELVAQAFSVATSGRPGPVVLALPEDVLTEESDAELVAPAEPAPAAPAQGDVKRLRALLGEAKRPLVIVGEGGWSAAASCAVLAFCEANELPVAASFRCQDFVDNRSDVYVGHLTLGMDPKLARRFEGADRVLAIGGRLGDIPTQDYSLLERPRPRQRLVHVHPDPEELGRVLEPELSIVADLASFARALEGLRVEGPWREWTREARADYLASREFRPRTKGVDLAAVVTYLSDRLPDDAIITCGAGNFTVWIHRFYEFRQYGTQLAPRAGAMGYGFPAALAAKVLHPERLVVCLAGDGDFMMSCAELATAVQYELPVIVLLANNGMFGTIRMHQERAYPGRVVGTDLRNPDFVALARSFGCHAEAVETSDAFAEAFERAAASDGPALLDLRVDPEAINPRQTIAEIRAASSA